MDIKIKATVDSMPYENAANVIFPYKISLKLNNLLLLFAWAMYLPQSTGTFDSKLLPSSDIQHFLGRVLIK